MGTLHRLRRSKFLRQNAIYFIGSLAIGLLNYLYYPVMGRLLHPDSFGEVQVLFSIFAQIAIFLNVFGLLTVNIAANYDNVPRRNRIIAELEKLAIFVGIALLVVTVLAGTTLQSFFRFGSETPFIILALSILVSIPLTFRAGFLRGKQYFGWGAFVGVVAAACDLVFSAILVLIGWSTTGAMLGLVFAQIVGFSFAGIIAHRRGFTESFAQNMIRKPDLRLLLPELKYALLVLCGSLAITILYSVDTIAVKHYFDVRTAGLYAGISTIARIIFYLTASVAQVLLPSIRLQQSAHENHQTLLKSFCLLVIIGGSSLAVFTLMPHTIISVLMGKAYTPYANLLPRLSLVIFVISLANLFIMYHMALRRYAVIPIVLAGVVLTYGLILFHHQSPAAIIGSLLYGSAGLVLMLGVWFVGLRNKLLGEAT